MRTIMAAGDARAAGIPDDPVALSGRAHRGEGKVDPCSPGT